MSLEKKQGQIKIKTNVVFKHLVNSDKRFIVEQGGTRSGKSYNIIMWIIFYYCMKNTGKTVSIVRKTSPSLQGTAVRDFEEIMLDYDLYDERFHNKTNKEYRLNGNLIEFIAVDDPQKIRGRKRNIAFLNEGNELTYEDFKQINFRTTEKVIIDFNPSMVFHWIYERVIPRKDEEGNYETDFFQTSFRDNPFLDESLVKEIESLKYTDPEQWEIYGLGNKAFLKDVIYSNWDTCLKIPDNARFSGYGLDFGYTADPTALVGVWEMDNDLYIRQIIHETGLTNPEIFEKAKDKGVKNTEIIFADSAEPKSIAELKKLGLKIVGTIKGADSVRHGIDRLKSKKIFITEDSKDLIKEIQMYKWKLDRDDNNLGVPVDANNHALDALRYWGLENIKRRNYAKYKFK